MNHLKLLFYLQTKTISGLQGQGHGREAAHQGSAVVRGGVEDDDLSRMSIHSQSQDHDRKRTLHQRHVHSRYHSSYHLKVNFTNILQAVFLPVLFSQKRINAEKLCIVLS